MLALCGLPLALTGHAAALHVSVDGHDDSPGTRERPLATLSAARDAARKAGPGPHEIHIHVGDYFLASPLVLSPEDSRLSLIGEDRERVRIFGGQRLTGWVRDGERFWQVHLPGAKEGTWDFRALLVNGRLATRATWPNRTDRLEHLGRWDLPLLPMLAGFWARQPTREELTVMPYKPGDVPEALHVANAEVRLYHMWAESLVGVASHDPVRHVLVMSSPAAWPMGACDRRQYVIYNIREGMTEPGQWYLDRSQGRLVYWPLPGEDMATADIIAPRLDKVIALQGSSNRPVAGVTLRNLTVHCTSPALRPAGWASAGLAGAVELTGTKDCTLENVTVSLVGGVGVAVTNSSGGVLRGCEVSQTGACGVNAQANRMLIENNHIHHLGVYYPGSAGVLMGGDGIRLTRNEIHDSPYSGVIGGGGKDCRIEENLVYRAMLVMHDGAAIYGNLRESVIRGNVVRDIRPNGKGFARTHPDEGSCGCVIEECLQRGEADAQPHHPWDHPPRQCLRLG